MPTRHGKTYHDVSVEYASTHTPGTADPGMISTLPGLRGLLELIMRQRTKTKNVYSFKSVQAVVNYGGRVL